MNISIVSISPLNIKEIEPADAKNACIATISPIIAITFAVMHAPRCQMRQPPEEQKEDEQQAIHAIQRTDMAGFPIPSPALTILKCRFHTPA